jgi:hypothetical protein
MRTRSVQVNGGASGGARWAHWRGEVGEPAEGHRGQDGDAHGGTELVIGHQKPEAPAWDTGMRVIEVSCPPREVQVMSR